MPDIAPFLTGFALSLGLIVAVGAQNAFVLRQGLRREHVGTVVAFCALADLVLIAAGVAGLGEVLGREPALLMGLSLGGVAYLGWYGISALRRALHPELLVAENGGEALSRTGVLARVARFTLLNPHVYLDTVLLVGSVGAAQPAGAQVPFAAGAGLASMTWFIALGFGARLLAPLLARPLAWRVLDLLAGATMVLLAGGLLTRVLNGAA
ncbi:LysE family transporter [Cereibacter sphaeroides]|uniref:LysE/ArgO family amino acid transporter n=1 Tax=Cereibacter sphaeroides TaxID=1063 RepID=UPI001F17B8C2|nr:LysE family transporter [Cereibacter sphaeroides]MCE6949927.1 LysE family transporter [Cereibacter sphaeroides]